MKHNNQHIIKKSYAKPVIEEVMIDAAISLNPSLSGEGSQPSLTSAPTTKESEPNYNESTYTVKRSPFGDASEPKY